MIEEIDLHVGDRESKIDKAREWINSGLIIVAPLENGYVFLVDSFRHDAVRAMHVLRGDELGVAAQVLISGIGVLDGIAREVSPQARTLMDAFWPGPLSFNLLPHRGLTWDLGDNKELDQVCVRVPQVDFVLELLRKTGPLAVASAALAGRPPVLDTNHILVRDADVAGIFSAGQLSPAQPSSVISDIGTITLIREGAITLDQLARHIPEIAVASSSN